MKKALQQYTFRCFVSICVLLFSSLFAFAQKAITGMVTDIEGTYIKYYSLFDMIRYTWSISAFGTLTALDWFRITIYFLPLVLAAIYFFANWLKNVLIYIVFDT